MAKQIRQFLLDNFGNDEVVISVLGGVNSQVSEGFWVRSTILKSLVQVRSG